MPRHARRECDSDIYHITARGAGRMSIFEDDDDRREFLRLLAAYFRDCSVDLLAWCLMSNHVHLLVKAPLPSISNAMRKLLGRYASFFNGKHGHVGHLFQGRFGSKPVLSDGQLMAVVRYIHLNPFEAGAGSFEEYAWSSYREFTEDPGDRISRTEYVLDIFGSKGEFERFHRDRPERARETQEAAQRIVLSDEMAKAEAADALGSETLTKLKELDRSARDKALAKLKRHGLSIRQIERLTGIGRGIIQRAVDEE